MDTSAFVNTYESNTTEYQKIIENNKTEIDLRGRMDHSLREYRREALVFSTLNMMTVIAMIGAYRFLSTK